ncbi:MAG: Gfo/Idh/MocA family protein [Blastocatellia bacterium]
MKRRDFVRQSVQATAALPVITGTALSYSRIPGANDRVNLGLIGCGGRGTDVANLMKAVPGALYQVLCDVYEPNTAQAKPQLNPEARCFSDFRKVLELKDIDAVHIATPDHWHAMATILACQAGKDVYVEKPLAHNIREGRLMVAAARKHNRIVQAGMQHRSAPHYREAQHIIQSGALGEVRFVRVWNYSNLTPFGIGKFPDAEPPKGLDWDMYLGPAPKVPFNKARFLRTFRWFWDYAGGTLTDFGTHRFDTVHQIMGADAPKSVVATGGRLSVNDGGEMPDVMQVTWEYPGFILSYEAANMNAYGIGTRTPGHKYYGMRGETDRPHGEAYYGTNGTLLADRIGYEVFPEPQPMRRKDGSQDVKTAVSAYRTEAKRVQGRDTTDLHCANFIECVRSRKAPNAEVEIGHRSTIVPHIGNISYKTGRKLAWNADKEDFVHDADASKLLSRAPRKEWNLL